MKTLRSGSNQMDVPVKPVWPKAFGPIFVPALEFSEGVSQPNARDEPAGMLWRCVNVRTSDFLKFGGQRTSPHSSSRSDRFASNHRANRARSGAVLNSPACPDTPP